jgi:hypothetical protein
MIIGKELEKEKRTADKTEVLNKPKNRSSKRKKRKTGV